MTPGQTRVLVLMLVIIGLEALFSQPFQDAIHGKAGGLTLAMFAPGPAGIPPTAAAVLAYGVGTVALVALAAPAPGVATGLAVIFLIGVLLGHGSQVAGLANNAAVGIGVLGAGAQTQAQGKTSSGSGSGSAH